MANSEYDSPNPTPEAMLEINEQDQQGLLPISQDLVTIDSDMLKVLANALNPERDIIVNSGKWKVNAFEKISWNKAF